MPNVDPVSVPVRAVHFALEPHCPYRDPADCPRETEARRAVEAHQQWQVTQRQTTTKD